MVQVSTNLVLREGSLYNPTLGGFECTFNLDAVVLDVAMSCLYHKNLDIF